MSNMSYCRFQNTVLDLADCYESLLDEDVSEDEAKARKRLVAICRNIVTEWDAEES